VNGPCPALEIGRMQKKFWLLRNFGWFHAKPQRSKAAKVRKEKSNEKGKG